MSKPPMAKGEWWALVNPAGRVSSVWKLKESCVDDAVPLSAISSPERRAVAWRRMKCEGWTIRRVRVTEVSDASD